MVFHSRRLCEIVRVTHDDRVELTFDNIVNGSDVLNRIEKIDSFRKIESEYFLNRNALLETQTTKRNKIKLTPV